LSVCPPPCFCSAHRPPHYPHSFPTRRSSDLWNDHHGQLVLPGETHGFVQRYDFVGFAVEEQRVVRQCDVAEGEALRRRAGQDDGDRKSTRLNSSHVKISYAVFCLKKKTTRAR